MTRKGTENDSDVLSRRPDLHHEIVAYEARSQIDTVFDRYFDTLLRNMNEMSTKAARSIDIFGFERARYRLKKIDLTPCTRYLVL